MVGVEDGHGSGILVVVGIIRLLKASRGDDQDVASDRPRPVPAT